MKTERKEALLRILVFIISGIILGLWKVLIQVVLVINWIYTLVNSKRNRAMAVFCNRWNTQVYKFLRYITMNTNERPFPFSPLAKDFDKYDSKKIWG